MTLGQKLKQLRKNANLSLRELAKRVGKDFTYLSKIENDRTDDRLPSEELIVKLAKVLNADETELLILAQRIPAEVKDSLIRNAEAMRFFRSHKDLPPEFWKKLNQEVAETRKK